MGKDNGKPIEFRTSDGTIIGGKLSKTKQTKGEWVDDGLTPSGVPIQKWVDTKQSEIEPWEAEFDEKMGCYTDGLPEMYIKGAKPGTKGFWLRSGMDGEIDETALKQYIKQLIDTACVEAYKKGYIAKGLEELKNE